VLAARAGETLALRLTVRGNRLTIRDGPLEVNAWTFTLRPAQKPKGIDLQEKGEAKGEKFLGIYRFRRGALTLLLDNPGHRRPRAFKSLCGLEQILLILVPNRPAKTKTAPKAKPGAAGGAR
jgi:uncharacterized protein (TIGR03067 family)